MANEKKIEPQVGQDSCARAGEGGEPIVADPPPPPAQ